MSDTVPPAPSSGRRGLHWDGAIGAGQVMQALVLIAAVVSIYVGYAVGQAAAGARLDAIERDAGAGSRITAALRENVDTMQLRLVALETESRNTLDRMEREYQERKDAQAAIQTRLDDYGRTLTDIASSVSAIAAATSLAPGPRP